MVGINKFRIKLIFHRNISVSIYKHFSYYVHKCIGRYKINLHIN